MKTQRPDARGMARQRRRRLAGITGILTVATVAAVYFWWVSPEHRIMQFVGAWGRRDWGRMLEFADPPEVEGLTLTPQKLEALFEECGAWTGGRYALAPREWQPFAGRQHLYNRARQFCICDQNGAALRGGDGNEAVTQIVAYKTDRGWKVGLSSLAAALPAPPFRGRRPAGTRLVQHRAWKRAGLPPKYLDPYQGLWRPLRPL